MTWYEIPVKLPIRDELPYYTCTLEYYFYFPKYIHTPLQEFCGFRLIPLPHIRAAACTSCMRPPYTTRSTRRPKHRAQLANMSFDQILDPTAAVAITLVNNWPTGFIFRVYHRVSDMGRVPRMTPTRSPNVCIVYIKYKYTIGTWIHRSREWCRYNRGTVQTLIFWGALPLSWSFLSSSPKNRRDFF